jgi:hypothetical protein
MAVQIEAPEATDVWTLNAALRELSYRLRQAGAPGLRWRECFLSGGGDKRD